jgi:8-oxo-dGTP pyrophosphatase MutT (NUDIX family)
MSDSTSDQEPDAEIPSHRLPDGFADGLEDAAAEPAVPRPAATVVLLRSHLEVGLQVLLLRRSRTVGFVPGAYVFPGGRVDPSDASDEALCRLVGTSQGELAARLAITTGSPPASAYLVAAFRETFEETGLLPGIPPQRLTGSTATRLREELLEDRIPFHRVLEELNAVMDARSAAYIAHWVTPEAEPRRYDTRFFALKVSPGLPVTVLEGEITRARWLSPALALDLHGRGDLPMVFPTVRTLEELSEFDSPDTVLDAFRRRRISRILPRLVRTPTGVGILVPRPLDPEDPGPVRSSPEALHGDEPGGRSGAPEPKAVDP